MNRNEFIRALYRLSLLTVMTLMTGFLVFRNKVTVKSDCTINKYCKSCSRLSGCSLPGAEKERKNGKG